MDTLLPYEKEHLDELAEIRQALLDAQKNGLSINRVARLAGANQATLTQFANGVRNGLSAETLKAITPVIMPGRRYGLCPAQ